MTSRTEHVHLKYSAGQLFDLIADVERYPEFLPWVLAARLRRREGQTIWVDMTLGTRFLRRGFSTVGLLERPHRITITSDDPMLERFEQRWTFKTAPEGGTDVEYRVDFRFRSRLLQALIGGPFADRARAMAHAFTQRARRLYGAPSQSNNISS
ncbi:MAG: type II toxin-antitoxin system RatA family toxin [Beijerinckiaceae bacterium]